MRLAFLSNDWFSALKVINLCVYHTCIVLPIPDNPLPGHDVISIKLNQRQQQEVIQTPEGEKTTRNIQLETVFEMNYTTGQWRKLQVKRRLDMPQDS